MIFLSQVILLTKQIQPPTPPFTSYPVHASVKTSVAMDNSCCATHRPQIPRHKSIACGDLWPPPPIVAGEHVGTWSPIWGVWCRRHGRNVHPCSRLSAGMFPYQPEQASVSQPRAFLASPEKISSVAFLLACTEGNSHPSTTGTPQLKAMVKRTGNAPLPPSLPLFFSISITSSHLSILSAPWSPFCPPSPNSELDSRAERSQVPHMELLL